MVAIDLPWGQSLRVTLFIATAAKYICHKDVNMTLAQLWLLPPSKGGGQTLQDAAVWSTHLEDKYSSIYK